MPKTVELPDGGTIEFPDNMSMDEINAAVEQHLAQSGGSTQSLSDAAGLRPATTEEGIVARSGVRALPPVAAANALAGGANALSWLGQKYLGLAPDQPLLDTNGQPIGDGRIPMPSEAIIHSLDLEPKQPLTTGQKVTESILPWLVPTGNQIGRVQEAAGPLNKVLTLGRSELGSAADWALSNAAVEYARQHGYGDVASTIAGMVGGGARSIGSRLFGGTVLPWFGRSDAGDRYDVNRDVGVTPPAGSVGGKTVSGVESAVSTVPGVGASVNSARNAQSKAIANAADKTLQDLSPGATSIKEGGPETLNAAATDLGNKARETMFAGETGLKAAADQLENNVIGLGRRVSAAPVENELVNIITDPNAGADLQAVARSALAKLHQSVAPDGSITFDALKQNRTAIGATIDNLFQAQSGARSIKNTLHAKMAPVEDAMTSTLADAAEQAQPGAGAQWRQLDQDWKANAQKLRDLSPIGGKPAELGPTTRTTTFENRPSSTGVAKDIQEAVRGDQPYIDAVDRSLGNQTARSAVAETIAAKAVPKSGARSTEYRPDTLGARGAEIGPDMHQWIEDQIGQENAQPLKDAIAAGKTVGEPREPSNLGRTITGSILASAPIAYGGLAGGVPGMLAAGGGLKLLTSSLEDPSFVRSVSGRGFTRDNAFPLINQYLNRTGLGATPQPEPLVKPAAGMLMQGVKNASTAALSPLARAMIELANQRGR